MHGYKFSVASPRDTDNAPGVLFRNRLRDSSLISLELSIRRSDEKRSDMVRGGNGGSKDDGEAVNDDEKIAGLQHGAGDAEVRVQLAVEAYGGWWIFS